MFGVHYKREMYATYASQAMTQNPANLPQAIALKVILH